VIQIATDCVYSGAKGRYVESDSHDAHDVYGKTKSMGEAPLNSMIHLRTSIIGPEACGRRSLLEWFLSRLPAEEITGYTNHFWNGITTLHFARICLGIIRNPKMQITSPQHIIAGDQMNKYEMLRSFAHAFESDFAMINPGQAASAVDRTLDTENPEVNRMLWEAAGYDSPPSVGSMIKELAKYDYKLKLD
jgi:dTDP-4-dehydrorhamnose reductase